MRETAKPLTVLLAIGLICRSFGPLSCDLERLLIASSLLTYFLITSPFKKNSALAIPFFLISSLLVARIDNPLGQLSGLSAFIFLLTLYSKWNGLLKSEHAISLLTSVFFTIIYFLYEYFPEGWYAVEFYAHYFSSVCSILYNRVLNLGPTSFGFFILVLFVIYHCVLYLLDKERSLARFVLSIVYLLCANIAFVGVNLLAEAIIRKYTFLITRSDLYTQGLLFFILSLSILFKRKRVFLKARLFPDKRTYKYSIPCFFLFAASFIYYTYPLSPPKPVNLKTVVFYKQGSLDWDTPRFGAYGQRSGGMFGLMPKYLNAAGFNSRIIDTISNVTLSDADVLVIINLNKTLDRQELFTLWDFVRSGGGLLLLGDHTNLGGLMNNFNQILKDVPIKFNFDSAMPSRYTWDYLMDVRPHPITNGFGDELGRAWWVGASVKCDPPAVPLVTGRYCYSDLGYKNNAKQAYLGNRRFDYYESLDDVVLAAISPFGEGKIMVCGDTSAFHNTTFMTTHNFVVNTFNILSNRDKSQNPNFQNLLKIAVVLLIAVFILLVFIPAPNIIIPVLFVALLSSSVLFSEHSQQKKQLTTIPFENLKVAFIDYSHYERFDLMSWEDDSIGGLTNNLFRNGFTPFLFNDFDRDKLLKAEALTIIAPTKPFTEKEVALLKDFVDKGGKLILSVGWEERDASLPILKGFGLDIDNVPLGWCTYVYNNTAVQFHEAWPVVYDSKDNVDVICKPLGFPAIVSKKSGKGKIILIADSYFLLNENLEGAEKFYVPNMFLFRDLLLR